MTTHTTPGAVRPKVDPLLPWRLHPDRALPADPGLRPIAREIYRSIANLPIISMHGHVDAALLDADQSFGNPSEVLVTPDHYLLRMLVSQGTSLSALGVPRRDGGPVEQDPREVFRRFAEGWHHFRGTPTRLWMEHVLVEVFGVSNRLSADTADAAYDRIAAVLARPDHRPLALLDRFGIECLATTDPATSDLTHHRSLADRGWAHRVIPTFRPDALLQVDAPMWATEVDALAAASGVDVTDYRSFLQAIEQRRQAFVRAGAAATDHGTPFTTTERLDPTDAARIFDHGRRRAATAQDAQAFAGHMLNEMARMSAEDGLVMQLHPGVLRDHAADVQLRHGSDVGYDIPVSAEFTRALRPLLSRWGHHPGFRLILFTLDEAVYSRELAPLAGVYPTVRLGAPWWFLDAPDAMRRVREAVVETAGFSNLSGFVDDTRAFFSIPARHDLARRTDAGHLARLVGEHRLDLDDALGLAYDLTVTFPRRAYARPDAELPDP
jgi:glucuronate isomerase